MFPFERDEPTLHDLLEDPLIQLVMLSDDVTRDEVSVLFERLKLERQAHKPPAELPI